MSVLKKFWPKLVENFEGKVALKLKKDAELEAKRYASLILQFLH